MGDDKTPAWVTAIQAGILGIVAGLALNALVSTLVLRGESLEPGPAPPPATCNKQAPTRDTTAPKPGPPALGQMGWALDGLPSRS